LNSPFITTVGGANQRGRYTDTGMSVLLSGQGLGKGFSARPLFTSITFGSTKMSGWA
jgi:hypothetical protein